MPREQRRRRQQLLVLRFSAGTRSPLAPESFFYTCGCHWSRVLHALVWGRAARAASRRRGVDFRAASRRRGSAEWRRGAPLIRAQLLSPTARGLARGLAQSWAAKATAVDGGRRLATPLPLRRPARPQASLVYNVKAATTAPAILIDQQARIATLSRALACSFWLLSMRHILRVARCTLHAARRTSCLEVYTYTV